jgi:hypothetical protein
MSTTYYRLRPPITSLRVLDRNPEHATLAVWVDHGLAGELIVPAGLLSDVVIQFKGDEIGYRATKVVQWHRDVGPTECLISEYGELTSRVTLERLVAQGK